MTVLDKIWAVCSGVGRRREADGMPSLGFFDAANNRQGSGLIRILGSIVYYRGGVLVRSCGAGRENGNWFSRIGGFPSLVYRKLGKHARSI